MSLRHLVAGLLAAVVVGPLAAAPAHEHGVATLSVGVEAARVILVFHTPLDNLLGFERAPRTDAEREKVAAVVSRLRAADGLFRIDPAAACVLGNVDLSAPVLGLGPPGAAAQEGHADLDAVVFFRCTNAARAGFVEVGLFEAFGSLKRVDLQLATPKGQMKVALKRPQSRVALVR